MKPFIPRRTQSSRRLHERRKYTPQITIRRHITLASAILLTKAEDLATMNTRNLEILLSEIRATKNLVMAAFIATMIVLVVVVAVLLIHR